MVYLSCMFQISKTEKDTRMYPYVTRMLLVCLHMLLVCIRISRVLLVCIRTGSSDVISV